jgi:hypothetical protein
MSPCPPIPAPLETDAAQFDDLFTRASQRQAVRQSLAELLLPAARNKTLTALAHTEPVVGALELVGQAMAQQWPCRAVVADSFYGEHHGFTAGLQARGVPYVVALKPSHAWWAPVAAVGAVWEVAAAGGWGSPEQPGVWVAVERSIRDGHPTTWWGLEGVAGPSGPDRHRRLVIATPDPATLPEPATWYLAPTLPLTEASLAEVVRFYGLRT